VTPFPFESKLRELQEQAAEILGRLSISDLELAAQHHSFLHQMASDELARRQRRQ